MSTNLRLVQTCGACPEQYDVFDGDEQVGYLRLRHGHFDTRYPDAGGETVYSSNTNGDGVFDDDEREYHINMALKALGHADETRQIHDLFDRSGWPPNER